METFQDRFSLKPMKFLEDLNLSIDQKKPGKKALVPPKIKGKHFTNMEYLVNADHNWLTPNYTLSRIYNPLSDNSYFEQMFKPLEKLGEGSFGSVIKVRSRDCNNLYAIKISKEPFKTSYDRKMSIREVEHHRTLSFHPNIVTLYKAWEEDRFLFMQMELCKPCIVDGQAMSETECWNVLADILQALDYIHESGRGHFDVKVENIVLGQDNLYKLCDFGLMAKLGDKDGEAREGDAKYVAPEVIQHGHFSPKADIFSLGISILEMSSNLDLPSDGVEWEALRHSYLPYETVHRWKDISELIYNMMELNPLERPSAKEILALPKMMEVVQKRKMMKWNNFLIQLPSKEISINFCISLSWTIAIMWVYTLAILMEKASNAEVSMDVSTAYLGGDSTDRSAVILSEAESKSPQILHDSGFEEVMPSRTAYVAEEHTYAFQSRPMCSSTPMIDDEPCTSRDYILASRIVKKMKYELNSSSDDEMEQSVPLSSVSDSAHGPPSHIYCDWVGITSPDRAVRDASVNKDRLHCPSESLLQYGISPIRLSKACKEEYKRQNARRKRSIVPRNLSKLFDAEEC